MTEGGGKGDAEKTTTTTTEDAVVKPDEDHVSRPPKRSRIERAAMSASRKASIRIVYGHDEDDITNRGGDRYFPSLLRSCESILNHRIRQSPDVFKAIALGLKNVVRSKVSYLKFLFPTSSGYEQVLCHST